MEESVKERLIRFIKYKKLSQKKFEEECGLSNGYINSLRHAPSPTKLQRILYAYPEINRTWLLSGDGDMLVVDKPFIIPDKNGIPLIPTNAIGGALSGVGESFMEYECERYIVPQFSNADFLIRVQGDSMMPKYIPGDIVACKRVTDRIWFQWGKAYIIDTRQGVLIKRIEPSKEEGCISLHSENERYKPFDLPAEELNGVAIVIGVIRVE